MLISTTYILHRLSINGLFLTDQFNVKTILLNLFEILSLKSKSRKNVSLLKTKNKTLKVF